MMFAPLGSEGYDYYEHVTVFHDAMIRMLRQFNLWVSTGEDVQAGLSKLVCNVASVV